MNGTLTYILQRLLFTDRLPTWQRRQNTSRRKSDLLQGLLYAKVQAHLARGLQLR
jgi:hypothetical protein